MLFVVTTVVMLGSVSRHENVAGVHNTFAQHAFQRFFFKNTAVYDRVYLLQCVF